MTDRAFLAGAISVAPPKDNPNGAPQLSIDESKLALRQGDKGPEVQALQEQLAALGYTNAKKQPLTPDGDFGPGTVQALSAFQKDHPLPNAVPGVADVATQKAVQEQVQAKQQQGQTQGQTTPNDPRNANHSDHAMNQSVRDQLQALCATRGIALTPQQLDNSTAGIMADARTAGMTSVSHLEFGENHATGKPDVGHVIAYQGNPNDLAGKISSTDMVRAVETPAAQSYQQFAQATNQQAAQNLAQSQAVAQQQNPQQTQSAPRM